MRFVPRIYKTPFHFQAGLTPQDAAGINFCPCGNSWMKSFYAVYCYFTFQLDSPVFIHGAAFYSGLLVFVGSLRSEAVRIQAIPSVAKHTMALNAVPNRIVEILRLVEKYLAFSLLLRTCIFWVFFEL